MELGPRIIERPLLTRTQPEQDPSCLLAEGDSRCRGCSCWLSAAVPYDGRRARCGHGIGRAAWKRAAVAPAEGIWFLKRLSHYYLYLSEVDGLGSRDS